MRVIIACGNIKREINGPFNICGSREDLLRIAELLIQHCYPHHTIDDEGQIYESGRGYGWVEITDPSPVQRSIPNTKPLGWED